MYGCVLTFTTLRANFWTILNIIKMLHMRFWTYTNLANHSLAICHCQNAAVIFSNHKFKKVCFYCKCFSHYIMFQSILRRYLVAQNLKLHNAVTLLQNRHIYVTPGDITFVVIALDFKQFLRQFVHDFQV